MSKGVGKAVVAIGLLAVGVPRAEPAAFGTSRQHGRPVTLMVLIDDSASVPVSILASARQHAARVFQNIDVEIVWREEDAGRLPDAASRRSVVVVHLVTGGTTDRMHPPDRALGITEGTALATVFYNRVQEFSPTRDANEIACMLGHLIAHELGHLLFPREAHSRTGIMQAGLNVQLAARGALFFTADQARQIRRKLTRS